MITECSQILSCLVCVEVIVVLLDFICRFCDTIIIHEVNYTISYYRMHYRLSAFYCKIYSNVMKYAALYSAESCSIKCIVLCIAQQQVYVL